jgi:hypothetical protein
MAVSVGLARLAGLGDLWLVAAIVGVVVFWQTLPLEQRASRTRGYRLSRDVIRIVAGSAILGVMLQAPRRDPLPPAEIIGALLLLPVAFFLLRRLDVVLGLAGPVRDAGEHGTPAAVFGLAGPEQAGLDTGPPGWGSDFLQNPKIRSALAIGFFPGMLGFALGRDARILSALVLWALVSVVVMIFNGALSDLIREGDAGPMLHAGAAMLGGASSAPCSTGRVRDSSSVLSRRSPASCCSGACAAERAEEGNAMDLRLARCISGLALLASVVLPAQAKVDPDIERQVGGVLSDACADTSKGTLVRLYGDVMTVEVNGRKVAAKSFRTLRQSPIQPAPVDFKVAFQGEVPGGDGLLFVLTHNKDGLFVAIVGGAKSLAPLGPGIVGLRLRHCDPNRNALANTPSPTPLPGAADLLRDARFKKAFLAALGPFGQERWLHELSGPAPASQEVVLAGQTFLKASVCKPHDCRDNSLVLLWDHIQGQVYLQLYSRGKDATLGSPPPRIATELPRLWKQEWRP